MNTKTNTILIATLTSTDWDGVERRIFESGRGGLSYADYLPQGGHCGRITIADQAACDAMTMGLISQGATLTSC